MTSLARRERAALCALLARVGPDVSTLCGEWTARDLAAHLAARDRRLDSLPGLAVRPFAGWTERVRRKYRRLGYGRLLELLQSPAWWSPASIPGLDSAANSVEFFVHHEDVRRAGANWSPRELSRTDEETLWARTSMASVLLRPARMTVKLVCPGYGQRTVGRGPVAAVVTGAPGEVILFCFGRQSASQVEVTGDGAAQLRAAPLGM